MAELYDKLAGLTSGIVRAYDISDRHLKKLQARQFETASVSSDETSVADPVDQIDTSQMKNSYNPNKCNGNINVCIALTNENNNIYRSIASKFSDIVITPTDLEDNISEWKDRFTALYAQVEKIKALPTSYPDNGWVNDGDNLKNVRWQG